MAELVHTLTDIVKGKAQLLQCKKGVLTYCIRVDEPPEEDGFIRTYVYYFEIDTTNTTDVGEDACFHRDEKGILLMRWIRRAIDTGSMDVVEGLVAPIARIQK